MRARIVPERVDVSEENVWADYVFDDDYVLMPIAELEAYIKEHKHLPGVPRACYRSRGGHRSGGDE